MTYEQHKQKAINVLNNPNAKIEIYQPNPRYKGEWWCEADGYRVVAGCGYRAALTADEWPGMYFHVAIYPAGGGGGVSLNPTARLSDDLRVALLAKGYC